MSDTPRTDAILHHSGNSSDIGEFARKLERELFMANATIRSLSPPEEPEAASLPDDFRRIALLFTSRCTRTKMTAGEKRAWEGAKGKLQGNEFDLLEWFYGLDKSPEFDCTWRRVGMPATLLNNLDAQLDFAYEHKEALRKSQPKLGTAPQW